MRKEGLKKSIFLLVLGIFLINSISAVALRTCDVIPRANCNGANDHIVMGLTDLTNAHGQNATSTGTYNYVLCCGTESLGDTFCRATPSNKLIGLSSTTNAHAEEPLKGNYLVPVCYEDFSCVKSITGSCPVDYKEALSLTAETNAHIGGPGDYPIKICCTSPLFIECNISKVEWDITNVVEYEIAPITVTGNGIQCAGKNVSFIVQGTSEALPEDEESVVANITFDAMGIATTSPRGWTARYEGVGLLGLFNPAYKVSAYLEEDPSVIRESSNEVTVTPLEEDFCLSVENCEGYELENQCNTDTPCNKSISQGATLGVNCSEVNCGCAWNLTSQKCGFVTRDLENPSFGYCSWSYISENEDQCEDTGMRTIQKEGNWIGTGNEGLAYEACIAEYEPQVVPCPAQTKLPFFDTFTLIISLVVIVFVYVLLSKKKANKEKKKIEKKSVNKKVKKRNK